MPRTKKPAPPIATATSAPISNNQTDIFQENTKHTPIIIDTEINKTSNAETDVKSLKLQEVGTTGLVSMQTAIEKLQPYELKWPKCLETFNLMANDGDVAAGLKANVELIERAFKSWKVKPGKANTKRAKQMAKQVEWSLRNMEDGYTVRKIAKNMITEVMKYGFGVAEKNFVKVKEGEYIGKYKIKSIPTRPVPSLDLTTKIPFDTEDGGRTIKSVRQNANYFYDIINDVETKSNYSQTIVTIPRSKFMLFGTGATDSQPLGVSPLKAIWKTWREKNLLENQEVVGVSKDLAGIFTLYVPSSILIEAANDPASDSAKSLSILDKQVASLHKGDQTHIRLPSDLQEGSSTVRDYEAKLLGIDGGGGKIDTDKLVARRVKRIHTLLGTTFLIVGQDGAGAFNLASSNKSYHSSLLENNIASIEEVFNNDLIPQLMKINGYILKDEEMPVFEAGFVEDPDVDTNSKAIQRAVAVGAVPIHPLTVRQMLEELGYNPNIVPDNVIDDYEAWADWSSKYMPKAISRSGDGMSSGSGGLNGTADNVDAEDNSVANNENV